MTQPVALSNRSQVALQSYLDDLLFDATQALEAADPAPAPAPAQPEAEP
ncbi:chemotaxis protein CheW, partial [Pseudomonas sp. FSL A6-1183]|nr:chemotaxis protein CheW [Pseudomonas sp. FSL A6-1183]